MKLKGRKAKLPEQLRHNLRLLPSSGLRSGYEKLKNPGAASWLGRYSPIASLESGRVTLRPPTKAPVLATCSSLLFQKDPSFFSFSFSFLHSRREAHLVCPERGFLVDIRPLTMTSAASGCSAYAEHSFSSVLKHCAGVCLLPASASTSQDLRDGTYFLTRLK